MRVNSKGAAGQTLSRTDRKLLVVDDDEEIHHLFRYCFSEELELHFASSADEALGLADRHRFPLVLLDIRMPGKSGMEILPALRRRSALQKVIILTGHSSKQTAIKAINLGAYGYIEKPFLPDRMRMAIEDGFEQYFKAWCSPVERITPHELAVLGLTQREAEISCCVARGQSNMEIAARIGLSSRSIEKTLESVFSKLKINSRMKLGPKIFELISRL